MEDRDMTILEITVRTKTSENVIDLAEDLKIDVDNINEAFIDQPCKYAYWATVAAQAKTLADRKKLEVEKQEDYLKKTLIGELDIEVRRDLELEGEKITESKVTNSIFAHDRYKEESEKLYKLKAELVELQAQVATLEAAREAMDQRKDSLISLGAQLRTDGGNADLTIKKQQANEIINRNRASKK